MLSWFNRLYSMPQEHGRGYEACMIDYTGGATSISVVRRTLCGKGHLSMSARFLDLLHRIARLCFAKLCVRRSWIVKEDLGKHECLVHTISPLSLRCRVNALCQLVYHGGTGRCGGGIKPFTSHWTSQSSFTWKHTRISTAQKFRPSLGHWRQLRT